MNTNQIYNLSDELLIKPYKNGVTLAEPTSRDNKFFYSISKLHQSPIPSYFMNTTSHIVETNEATAELVGVQSIHDTLGKNAKNFVSNEFATKLLENDKFVISNASMKVIEETGLRNDDALIQTMTIKLPWYHENKVIGLLGWSIHINQDSLPNFVASLSQLISTGLIGHSQTFTNPVLSNASEKIVFTKREYGILSQLIRGKTAKEIGIYFSISTRTTEHYIENIKIKSNCRSKSELISKFFDEFKLIFP